MSEYRTTQNDSFWSWRKRMYEFLEELTPESVFKIGCDLYRAMRSAGYTVVGEFHYLLHQPDGTPYDNVNEMADALIEAAGVAGIQLCILPVYYQRGGFDNSPLEGGQLRFGSEKDLFLRMLEKLVADHANKTHVRIGWAIHSLRAVSIEAAQAIQKDADTILPNCPIHIHVSEQTQEVSDCIAATGRRPIQLLLDSFDVGPRWCLIHATHMTPTELADVASSGAVIGVCPTTEANLGDGIFAAEAYMQAQGKLAIGSDSHVCLDPREELRLLEYGQRLSLHRRAVLCNEQHSCGEFLTRWVAEGGAQATGFASGQLCLGSQTGFNLVPANDHYGESDPARALDRWIFVSP